MASRDYEEFVAALNAHGVRYLIVGAHAVAYHAQPRATKDERSVLPRLHRCTNLGSGKITLFSADHGRGSLSFC